MALDECLSVYTVLLDEGGIVRRANAFARQVSGNHILGKAFGDLIIDFHGVFILDDFLASKD